MRRHLFLKIYLAFVAITVMCVVAAGLAAHLLNDQGPVPDHIHEVAEVFAETLPADPGGLVTAVEERSSRLSIAIALYDPDGARLATSGEVPEPRSRAGGDHWIHTSEGPAIAVRLRDGRWLVARPSRGRALGPRKHLLALLVLGALMAAGTYPLARSITRRIENLRRGVEDLGGGDLGTRVEVEGCDEVAALAGSFNRAADRIEALLQARQQMLASASHELRSPLARLRLSVELLREADSDTDRDTHLAEAVRDVEELDRLVEDLLLVGRLEAGDATPSDPVELLGLAAEEAARVGAEVGGREAMVAGDEMLLRILLRNLLENARRHGAPPIEVEVGLDRQSAWVRVTDAGPGVAPEQRERIFEPFYRPPGQPEETTRGAGLGLALVRRVAAHHGGHARCELREGGAFIVHLPRLAVPAREHPAGESGRGTGAQ